MNNYAYALIVIGLVNIIFGFYVLISSKKSQAVRFLALSIISLGLWGVGLAGFLSSNDVVVALYWSKFHYVASIYIVYFILLFEMAFTQKKKIDFQTVILLQVPILLISLAVVFSDSLIIKDVVLEDSGNVAILNRVGHITYGVVFAIYYLIALIINLTALIKSKGILRNQLALIFSGFLLTGLLGGTFNLILPILGNYKLIWIGPQFSIIFLGLIFIAIVKYQLFNIRLLVGKVLYIVTSASLLYITFRILLDIHIRIFGEDFGWEALTFGIVISILFSVLYDKYREFFQEKISTKIINLGYDASKYIDRFTYSLGNIVTEDSVLKELYGIIKETIDPIYFSIIVKRESTVINKQYTGNKVFDSKRIFEILDSPMFAGRGSISLGELIGISSMDDESYRATRSELISLLERSDLHLLVPVRYDKELVAIFVLGKRDLNSTMYIEQEIEFLQSLASITGASLARAILYQQVQSFNINLQKDVSEKTKELQRNVEELENARRKERDMLDIMGHELRTPATIVKLNADLLRKFVPNNPKSYQKYLDRIKNSIENEIRLIDTLLSSAKLEGKKIELNKERLSIPEQIETVLHGYEYQIGQKGLRVMVDFEDGIKDVYADKVRVVEIIDNLLSNAIKYTDEGSIILKAEDTDDYVKVSIIDSGKGIPEKEIPRLGTKFRRIENYITGESNFNIVRPGGTGLGLYVVYALVEMMGGKIWVHSQVGKGTTFSFTLPVYKGEGIKTLDSDEKNLFEKFGLKK